MSGAGSAAGREKVVSMSAQQFAGEVTDLLGDSAGDDRTSSLARISDLLTTIQRVGELVGVPDTPYASGEDYGVRMLGAVRALVEQAGRAAEADERVAEAEGAARHELRQTEQALNEMRADRDEARSEAFRLQRREQQRDPVALFAVLMPEPIGYGDAGTVDHQVRRAEHDTWVAAARSALRWWQDDSSASSDADTASGG